ncbi:MAG: helix-turn-helix transcriptional regulator [Evtepia sp.]|nr:helix-turn-helix transcriptional regulator [Evtepia sp.]
MGTMTQTIGLKLRRIRLKRGYSQEALADRAGLHPTYIGQVERGEKNITVESLHKITTALEIPISAAFDDLPSQAQADENYPLRAYQLFSALEEPTQKKVFGILREIRDLL